MKYLKFIIAAWLLLVLSVLGTVIYVAHHFITKYW